MNKDKIMKDIKDMRRNGSTLFEIWKKFTDKEYSHLIPGKKSVYVVKHHKHPEVEVKTIGGFDWAQDDGFMKPKEPMILSKIETRSRYNIDNSKDYKYLFFEYSPPLKEGDSLLLVFMSLYCPKSD